MSEQKIEVYRISKNDTFDNSHFINRDETWTARKVGLEFSILDEAKEYIRQMSLEDIVRYSTSPDPKFVEKFCFEDDKWYHERRYFIGPPDWRKIRKGLEKDGIHVISSKS